MKINQIAKGDLEIVLPEQEEQAGDVYGGTEVVHAPEAAREARASTSGETRWSNLYALADRWVLVPSAVVV